MKLVLVFLKKLSLKNQASDSSNFKFPIILKFIFVKKNIQVCGNHPYQNSLIVSLNQ